jgi:hypothetical protein
MAYGFFTVEQWKRGRGKGRWVPVLEVDACESLTKAVKALGEMGKAGLYRVVQTQRCIWAEMEGGKVRLHGSHAGSAEGLARLTDIYDRTGGRRPVEEARKERARAKRARGG